MPGQLSTVGANLALDGATGRDGHVGRTVYLALLTAAPSDSTTVATMTEVTTTGYARQAIGWAVPSSDPSITSNVLTITFGPFTADPPNVPYLALVSSSSGTGGDFLAYWTADTARDAANGESIQIAAGGLTLSID
jgi:hypothetical protein